MNENILDVFLRMIKKHGFFQSIKFGFNIISQYIFLSKYFQNKRFYFQNKEYSYFLNFLNGTLSNERIIEIPIITEILKKNQDKKILEIGNVISKYYNFPHTIVDKYERGDGVINEDVAEYNPDEKYDLIFSISTMEHVGFDEMPQEPEKLMRSFENLKSLLEEEGKIIITMPLGYNKFLDENLEKNNFGFNKQFFFKKDENFNTWKEVDKIDFNSAKYEEKFPPHANELILAIYEKK